MLRKKEKEKKRKKERKEGRKKERKEERKKQLGIGHSLPDPEMKQNEKIFNQLQIR